MHIFLSIPFSSRIAQDGTVETSYRALIEHLLAGLRVQGHDVYCALEYAKWKVGGLTTAEDELKHDFAEIDAADNVLVLLEERVSAGIQLECGYAFAKHKLIRLYQIGTPAWSNGAFAKLNGNDIIPIENDDDFVRQVLQQF